jgi:hypothetical protein
MLRKRLATSLKTMKILKLNAGAFNQELAPIIGTGKIGWTPDDHIGFVTALIKQLRDNDGNPPRLDRPHNDRLKLVYRPTEDVQRSVLRQTFADAGYELDAATEATFILLLSAAQFGSFLATNDNPETGEPFITLEQKRGVKKKTFASLLASPKARKSATQADSQATPAQDSVPTAGESPQVETEDSGDTVSKGDEPQPAATKKPASKKD